MKSLASAQFVTMFIPMKTILLCVFYYGIISIFSAVDYEKITFFAVERPKVLFINTNHIAFANISARRFNRKDPVYYFSGRFVNVHPIGNNYTLHFYFYEFLTNVYKPSFVEVHMKACLVKKEPIFGAVLLKAIRQLRPNVTCPLPPGDWNLQNLTMNAAILKNFPFPKGRIYLNLTFSPTDDLVGAGYVDFQIKDMKVKVADKSK